MKINTKLLLAIYLIFISLINGQVVYTDPYFATENDSIVVYFDASKGNQGLLGYTGNVYAHTGVITNLSTSSSDWKYVIGNWGNNTTQPKLQYRGGTLYRLAIGNPRQYYDISNVNEHIEQLAFVFRSSDNYYTGREVGGADIFADLYEEGLNLVLASPSEDFTFVELNETIEVLAISSQAETLSLYLNDDLITTTSNDSLIHSLLVNQTGLNWIKVFAESSNGEVKGDSAYYIVKGNVNVAEKPEGIVDGINYITENTVTLSLYAPGKEFVYVIGDFNGWLPHTDYQMKVTPDGDTFWLTVNNLIPNEEYGFQYLIDGELVIPDPYADKILDPWNDSAIPATVYPGLKEYPESKTTNIVSVLETNQSPYEWNILDFERPAKEELIIYELLIRDFLSSHSLKTLKDTLSYFEKLGVNAIELMPVNEFEGNSSWGYNPMMYFAVDKYYGTKNDLKAFIDAAHEKGIAVIKDIVLNHSYGLNPMVRMYFDDAKNQPSADNPWFNQTSPNSTYSWGYDFNHESEVTKQFVDRVNRYWLTEYKFDGFRFDFTKGFTNTPGDGGSYDASRIQILKRMADKIWETEPESYVILEHFAPVNEERELTDYGIMTWHNLNHPYNEATMGFHDGFKSNFSNISYKNSGKNYPRVVGYMESHDEERLMYKNLTYGNSHDWYDVQNLQTALNRVKMANAFFLTVPGPKMIWQFGELGYDYSIDYNGRVGEKPIRWNYYTDENRHKLFETVATLIELRKNYEVFSTDDFGVFAVPAIKRIRLNHEEMNATILGNFDVVAGSTTPHFQHTGYWYDYFSGDSIFVSDTTAGIFLAPGEFHIYTDKRLPVPANGELTDIEDEKVLPDNFTLSQNYPNPFNPSTTLKFTIPNVGTSRDLSLQTKLVIYDALGRKVATLVNETKAPGTYTVTFDGSNFSSGVYFYRIAIHSDKLTSGSFTQTKKMLLLK